MKVEEIINEFVFTFSLTPPSVNTLWRRNPRGGMYLSKKAREFYERVRLIIGQYRAPDEWPFYSVAITIHPPRKSGDVDNYIKPVLDALTKSGFWPDDKLVAEVSCRFGRVKKGGSTVVLIRPKREKYNAD